MTDNENAQVPLLIGIVGDKQEEWFASDAAFMYRMAKESGWNQSWLSCFDYDKFVKAKFPLSHFWSGKETTVYDEESEPSYRLSSPGRILKDSRRMIKREIRSGRHARVLVCFFAHGYCHDPIRYEIGNNFRLNNVADAWPEDWGKICLGRHLYGPGELLCDLQNPYLDGKQPPVSVLLTSCYSAKFLGIKVTTAAASNQIESFAYPETETMQRRSRGGIYMGALARVSTSEPVEMPIKEFLALVQREATHSYAARLALTAGITDKAYWHKVIVPDLGHFRKECFPATTGNLSMSFDGSDHNLGAGTTICTGRFFQDRSLSSTVSSVPSLLGPLEKSVDLDPDEAPTPREENANDGSQHKNSTGKEVKSKADRESKAGRGRFSISDIESSESSDRSDSESEDNETSDTFEDAD